MTAPANGDPTARIFCIKRGVNPNSSSVGSDIPAFLFSAAALTVVGAIAVQVHDIIRGAFAKGGEDPKREPNSDAR